MSIAKVAIVLTAPALLAAAIACGSNDAPAPPAGQEAQAEASLQAASQQSLSGSGIWVTGTSTVSVEPDLVILTVGVEAMGQTVAAARSDAARSMDAIVSALAARGIRDRDVKTVSVNIWPQYEYPEVISDDVRTRRQVLVGYTVSNSAAITVREVEAAGEIIDEVAAAGGDATRINGIRFTIEDPSPFMAQLREDAVKDALSRAQHLASLAGVAVGDLIFISESGAGTPGPVALEAEYLQLASFDYQTPVSGGEQELRLSIRAAFSIR